jgi:exonuclease VII large subunit
LNNQQNRLVQKTSGLLASVKSHLETRAGKLTVCNPKSILNRGYSITKLAATGVIIKSIAEININNIIITELKDANILESKVIKK